MQEWEVIVEPYCVGSTVDLKQVYGQIVTARNCQEKDGFEYLTCSTLEERSVSVVCCRPLNKS
jgi:hypothetical protein